MNITNALRCHANATVAALSGDAEACRGWKAQRDVHLLAALGPEYASKVFADLDGENLPADGRNPLAGDRPSLKTASACQRPADRP